MLYDAVSLTSLIMARLWMALIAFPAGLVLSALLIGNDFSTVKVMESVMVTGADALRSIERGEKEGTYRWTECKAAVTEEVAGKLPSTTCSERVAHEGPLTEMLATASYYVFMSYSVLAFLAFGVMLQFWPQSRFALRSKLARRLRIKRS
jgi:hypothetical protein